MNLMERALIAYYRLPKDYFKRYADNALNAYETYLSILMRAISLLN